ncbi:MAG: hypothetical protein HOC71_14010, partial [Candidatus Latescibacteria bacterium]|nr:hypothetical protein [Candidatus Latescibacterota bacterium]
DMHNHTPSHGYTDNYYNNPRDYLRYNGNAEEIVFWGEDGGIYGPPRVQLIKEYYDTSDGPLGWQGRHFIEWYLAYDEFLTGSGFREFFPDVDAFTVSLGNTTLYYHGRIIENVRIGNLGDCYTINGWAAPHVSNQAEVADLYRNPVGDPEIISRYCNPLYVAVKLRDKVVPVGSAVTADFFLVNDKGLNGPHTLTVTLEHNGEKCGFEKTLKAKIKGNEDYGQLLVENVEIKLDENPGYYSVRAALHDRKGKIKAEGSDDIFTVDIRGAKIPTKGAVVDTSGAINRMLAKTLNFTLPRFTSETTDPDYIIIGPNTYRNANQIASVMDCVANGATAVVIADADRFAEFLTTADHMQAIEYRGSYRINKGNFIAGKHGLLSGLPQAQAFNWEYQAFYNLRGHNVHALRLKGGETVVAAVADRKKEVFTALSIIPFGRGKIILSTLSILPHLNSDTPQSVVAKRLFLNFLMYACTES